MVKSWFKGKVCRFIFCFIIEVRRLRFSMVVDFRLDGFNVFVFLVVVALV